MKSFELKPTEENLLSTYKNDQIGRNTDIHAFVDILLVQQDMRAAGYVIPKDMIISKRRIEFIGNKCPMGEH